MASAPVSLTPEQTRWIARALLDPAHQSQTARRCLAKWSAGLVFSAPAGTRGNVEAFYDSCGHLTLAWDDQTWGTLLLDAELERTVEGLLPHAKR